MARQRTEEVNRILAIALLMLAGCGEGPSDPPVTVFMGDSITSLWPLPSSIVNAGISGNLTAQMLARFQADVLDLHPSTVEILGGTNDVRQLTEPDTQALASMADEAAASGACVILGTLPPSTGTASAEAQAQLDAAIAAWNSAIELLARAHGYLVADYHTALVSSDGTQNAALFQDPIHPNNEGFARMWQVVEP